MLLRAWKLFLAAPNPSRGNSAAHTPSDAHAKHNNVLIQLACFALRWIVHRSSRFKLKTKTHRTLSYLKRMK